MSVQRDAAVEALRDAEMYSLAVEVAAGHHLHALAHMAECCATERTSMRPIEDGGAMERALTALCRLHICTDD